MEQRGRSETTNGFLESIDSANPAPGQYDPSPPNGKVLCSRDIELQQPCVVCEPKIGLLNMAKPIV